MRTSKFSEEQIIGFLRQAEVGNRVQGWAVLKAQSIEGETACFFMRLQRLVSVCLSERGRCIAAPPAWIPPRRYTSPR
jgi:hypothetical protein